MATNVHTACNRSDLRRLLKLCSLSNREVVFLFIDTQIIDASFLDDINGLLQSGEVSNLFRHEDIQEVHSLLMALPRIELSGLDSQSAGRDSRSAGATRDDRQCHALFLQPGEIELACGVVHESVR